MFEHSGSSRTSPYDEKPLHSQIAGKFQWRQSRYKISSVVINRSSISVSKFEYNFTQALNIPLQICPESTFSIFD